MSDKAKIVNIENNQSYSGWLIPIILAVFLFYGEPDIHGLIVKILTNIAGQ